MHDKRCHQVLNKFFNDFLSGTTWRNPGIPSFSDFSCLLLSNISLLQRRDERCWRGCIVRDIYNLANFIFNKFTPRMAAHPRVQYEYARVFPNQPQTPWCQQTASRTQFVCHLSQRVEVGAMSRVWAITQQRWRRGIILIKCWEILKHWLELLRGLSGSIGWKSLENNQMIFL